MSDEDVLRTAEMARNPEFRARLAHNWNETIAEAKLSLDAEETRKLQRLIFLPDYPSPTANMPRPPAQPGPGPTTVAAAADPRVAEENVQNGLRQLKKRTDLIIDIYENIQHTFKAAHSTYHAINKMNYVMFATGIGLFITAGVYGAITHDKLYSFLFCGLGAASFIAQFMISPIHQTQVSLSNMAQTEIAIMNYLEQMMLLEPIAYIPRPDSPPGMPLLCVEHIERAAQAIQTRSQEAIQLLQDYVEADLKKGDRDSTSGFARLRAATTGNHNPHPRQSHSPGAGEASAAEAPGYAASPRPGADAGLRSAPPPEAPHVRF